MADGLAWYVEVMTARIDLVLSDMADGLAWYVEVITARIVLVLFRSDGEAAGYD